jgi:hypothetical protein
MSQIRKFLRCASPQIEELQKFLISPQIRQTFRKKIEKIPPKNIKKKKLFTIAEDFV